MIQDLDQFEASELPEYDLCIVGSGPAGTTIAAELAASGLRICVLESGRKSVTEHGDKLRPVESEGIYIKDYSRERVLGGTSTTWAGLTSPLDEIDFAERPWLRHSSWPIAREELVPYWQAAADRYRFAPLIDFEPTGGFGDLRKKSEIQPQWKDIDEKTFLAAAEAQNFGKEWSHIFEGKDVDAWLDATVIKLLVDDSKRSLQSVRIKTRSGREFSLRARTFVLATGGIENPRILLNSTAQITEGIGNEHDQVGRYLMNHPKNYHGTLHLAKPTGDLPFYYGCLFKGFAGYGGMRLKESYQTSHGLLNSYVRLEPLFPWTDSRGVEALVVFAKRSAFLMRSWKNTKGDKVVALRDYSETGDDSDVQNARKSVFEWIKLACAIPADLPSVLRYLQYRLITKAKPKIKRARIRNFMEMEPDPENRVILTEDRDVLGVRRPKVLHNSTEKDRKSVIELHEVLKREFSEQGFGRLESNLAETTPWPINLEASHHIGTTRMGTTPKTSVVNSDCRVHSVQNLYIAGASVFPTSGCANPTFTIVALSIRLAEHLGTTLGKSGDQVQ
ncbi:MAG: choline dehydrogenase-like flavoprotein [Planctomycetota bacterium]|jgi:choline dehydrogenase-like flavoprotein